MKFLAKKEDFYNGIKIVERATSKKALQPVLSNILIETVDKGTIRLVATDLELTVVTLVDAQVEEEGRITLPSSMLNEIVSKVGNKLISFEMKEGESVVNITCQNSIFDIIGISADEFPPEVYNLDLNPENSFEIEIKPLTKAVDKAGFAAAGYESGTLLSGIVCDMQGGVLEIASTDGNRLARVREGIQNVDGKTAQLIIPSKTLFEFIKVCSFLEEDVIKLYTERSRLVFKSERITLTSRLLDGQYPKYNQLISDSMPKEALVSVSALTSALERVAIIASDKTSIVKFIFSQGKLMLTADTPDSGKSEETLDIVYNDEELNIAFNYKFVLDALKKMDSDNVKIGLNTSLSATVLRPDSEEDFVCLIMPVQIR